MIHTLYEASNKYFSDMYENYFNLDDSRLQRYIDENDIIDIVQEAKDGNKLAVQAMYSFVEKMAIAKLFKEPVSFFGPHPDKRKMSSKEALNDYFGLVVDAVEGATGAINVSKLKPGKEIEGIQFYFRGYIMRACQKYHDSLPKGEISLNSGSDEDNERYGDTLLAKSGYESEDSSKDAEFFSCWQSMKNDPAYKGTAKLPIGEIFLDFMISGDLQQTANTYGVAKNTIRYNVFPKIKELLKKYEISQEELAYYLRSSPHKLFRENI